MVAWLGLVPFQSYPFRQLTKNSSFGNVWLVSTSIFLKDFNFPPKLLYLYLINSCCKRNKWATIFLITTGNISDIPNCTENISFWGHLFNVSNLWTKKFKFQQNHGFRLWWPTCTYVLYDYFWSLLFQNFSDWLVLLSIANFWSWFCQMYTYHVVYVESN